MENVNVPLPELIETVKTRLRELQYRPATIYGFSFYWKKLLEYAEERQAEFFTVALGEDFLKEVCHIDVTAEEEAPGLPRWKVNPPKRAVYLLEQDIPVQTISEILGHARVGSTKVYLQVDLEGLRKCAMDPDEVFANVEE